MTVELPQLLSRDNQDEKGSCGSKSMLQLIVAGKLSLSFLRTSTNIEIQDIHRNRRRINASDPAILCSMTTLDVGSHRQKLLQPCPPDTRF